MHVTSDSGAGAFMSENEAPLILPPREKSTWLQETEKFFFLGVMKGWAGGNDGFPLQKGEGTPGMEDWKEVVHRDRLGFAGYEFVERWGLDPDSGKPSCHIFITHWRIPVWGMWVGNGFYKKEAFPFLREALPTAYRKKEFRGGRGPISYRKGDLEYMNRSTGNFSRFSGFESVTNVRTGEDLGWHDFWGGSFAFIPQ